MRELLQSEFFITHREQIIKGGVIVLIVLAALVVFLFHTGGKDEIELPQESGVLVSDESEEAAHPEEQESIVVVDVAGAVKTPSVVYLDQGARVEDAIKAAGGLLDNADISTVNRASVLTDGQKIYIPQIGEEIPAGTSNESAVPDAAPGSNADSKVNINTASLEELQTLKGIGPATAEKIIEYRTLYGAFGSIEDITNVSGIGDKTFESIKDQITV